MQPVKRDQEVYKEGVEGLVKWDFLGTDMECHVASRLAVLTRRHAPEMGLLVFLNIDTFCPLVRSVVVEAS